MLTEKDLQSRKLPELKELGSKLEIPKAKTMKKGELVDAIKVKLNIASEAQTPKDEARKPDRKKHRKKRLLPKVATKKMAVRSAIRAIIKTVKDKKTTATAIIITTTVVDRKNFTLRALLPTKVFLKSCQTAMDS